MLSRRPMKVLQFQIESSILFGLIPAGIKFYFFSAIAQSFDRAPFLNGGWKFAGT